MGPFVGADCLIETRLIQEKESAALLGWGLRVEGGHSKPRRVACALLPSKSNTDDRDRSLNSKP